MSIHEAIVELNSTKAAAIECQDKEIEDVLNTAIEALEQQRKIKRTTYTLEEIIARNILAWETSKDKSQGLLPEIYLIDRVLFNNLTGLEATFKNLNKYIK